MAFVHSLIQIVAADPFCWPLAFWPLFFLLLTLAALLPGRGAWLGRLKWVWPSLALITLAAFVWFNYVFLCSPLVLDHVQAQVADNAWYFAQGKPLYQDNGAAEVYNLPYGPSLFVITGWFEKVLGPDLFSAKLSSALAVGATLLLLFLLLRKRAGNGFALIGTGIFVSLLMVFPGDVLMRAEIFIVLFLTAGGWAAASPAKFAPFALGVLLGLSADLKPHAIFYFLPLGTLAWEAGHRWKSLVKMAVTTVIVALLPFIVFPNISLRNYLGIMSVQAAHGADPNNYLSVLVLFLMMALPIGLLLALAHLRDARATADSLRTKSWLLKLTLAAFLLLLPFASKYGAGPHHVFPFAIVLLLLLAELYHAGIRWTAEPSLVSTGLRAALFSWLLGCLITGMAGSYNSAVWLQDRAAWAQSANADLDSIMAKYGANHIILMGLSDEAGLPATYLRTRLICGNMPIGFEPDSLMDLAFAGYPEPDLGKLTATLAQAKPGEKILWLMPKGTVPFTLDNFYSPAEKTAYGPHALLFDDHFRLTFQQSFKGIASTAYYDLYSN